MFFFSAERDFGVSLNDMSNSQSLQSLNKQQDIANDFFSKTSVLGYLYRESIKTIIQCLMG